MTAGSSREEAIKPAVIDRRYRRNRRIPAQSDFIAWPAFLTEIRRSELGILQKLFLRAS
jgi:hypothetical protein